MAKRGEHTSFEDRKFVSRLIYRVLAESLSVKDAILKFPNNSEDTSVRAAYHALVHLEADEELRLRDSAYKSEQDDYLEFIAQVLQKGENLPQNIIKSYDKYYKSASLPHKGTKELLKSLCKFLNV